MMETCRYGPGFRASKSPPSLLFFLAKKRNTQENHDVGTIGDLFFWKEMFRNRERLRAEWEEEGRGKGRRRIDICSGRASERARERERMECKKREWTGGRDWLKGHLRQGPRQTPRTVYCASASRSLHTHTHTHTLRKTEHHSAYPGVDSIDG